jgi:PBSX family phage terminase large subunit
MNKIIYEPSPKAKDVWKHRNTAKYRLLGGAVSSGKSYTANDIAMFEIQELPPCNVLISGNSIASVSRNVIAEWKNAIDPDGRKNIFRTVKTTKDEYMIIDWRGFKDKKFYVRGAAKDNDYKQIQGATFGYWLADEVTLHAKSFVNMARTRMRLEFSKAIWTYNPDSPYHYIKTDYLDNESLFVKDSEGNSVFREWIFYLNDNPSLTEKYIKELETSYLGVFYKRFIKGLWCIAEGIIHDWFNEKIHVTDLITDIKEYYYAIDYGTMNPCAFLQIGIDKFDKIFILREYYHDGRNTGKQKTDSDYANDFIDFMGDNRGRKIYIDPSAASFITELKSRNITGLTQAKNDVVDGIRTVQKFGANNQIIIHRSCKNVIKEFGVYSWDEKAIILDKPIKEHDHAMDALRYFIFTRFGERKYDLKKFIGG